MNRKDIAKYFRNLELKYKRLSERTRLVSDRDRFMGKSLAFKHAREFVLRQIRISHGQG